VDPDSTLFDADLDAPRPSPRPIPADSVVACQRLIVNPFIAVLGWLAATALIRYSLRSRNLPLHLTAIVWLFVPFLLVQFHCLDCHATGWYLRASHHLCGGVLARWARDGDMRSRLPRPRTQLLLWLYLLGIVSAVFLVTLRQPR
jgi:hypothetical protein